MEIFPADADAYRGAVAAAAEAERLLGLLEPRIPTAEATRL